MAAAAASGVAASSSKAVPQFLVKLFKMTNNPAHRDVVAWSDDGAAFWVSDISKVSRTRGTRERLEQDRGERA